MGNKKPYIKGQNRMTKRTNNDLQNQRLSNTNPTKNRGGTHVLL